MGDFPAMTSIAVVLGVAVLIICALGLLWVLWTMLVGVRRG